MKWIALLPVAVFPYAIWVVGDLAKAGGTASPVFSPVLLLGLFWLLGLAGAVVTLWQSLRGRWEGRKLALALALIPCGVFLLQAALLRHWVLAVFAGLFTGTHLYIVRQYGPKD